MDGDTPDFRGRPADDMEPDATNLLAGIRAKLAAGALPRRGPSWVRAGKSRGVICDACDSAIAPGGVEYEAEVTRGTVLRFHWRCVLMWDGERAIAGDGPDVERVENRPRRHDALPSDRQATTRWLIKLADVLQRRSTLQWDNAALEMVTETPLGTLLYFVAGIPLGERDDVYAALPAIATRDFAEAASLIRQAGSPAVKRRRWVAHLMTARRPGFMRTWTP